MDFLLVTFCRGFKALKGRCNLARAGGPGDNITGIKSAGRVAYPYLETPRGLKMKKRNKATSSLHRRSSMGVYIGCRSGKRRRRDLYDLGSNTGEPFFLAGFWSVLFPYCALSGLNTTFNWTQAYSLCFYPRPFQA